MVGYILKAVRTLLSNKFRRFDSLFLQYLGLVTINELVEITLLVVDEATGILASLESFCVAFRRGGILLFADSSLGFLVK